MINATASRTHVPDVTHFTQPWPDADCAILQDIAKPLVIALTGSDGRVADSGNCQWLGLEYLYESRPLTCDGRTP